MTEAEWLACDDPIPMLRSLGGRRSDRKLRLLTAACFRRIAPLILHDGLRRAVEIIECYADGQAGHSDMVGAAKTADFYWLSRKDGVDRALSSALWAATTMNLWNLFRPVGRTVQTLRRLLTYDGLEAAHQAELIRCVFAPVNLVRMVRPDARAIERARLAYDGRQFEALGVVADALEEAGGTDDALLSHLRSSGQHARGCWALDLVRSVD